MPRAGPLKQILRSLTIEELRALRRTYCPRVKNYDGDKVAFVDRLRHSLKRSMDAGEFTYEELMAFIRDELETQGPTRVSAKLRQTLETIEFSPNLTHDDTSDVRERWLCSELFQALEFTFCDDPYAVEQEPNFGRHRPDLLVTHNQRDRNYLIEAKLAGQASSRRGLLNQLRTYQEKVPNLRRSYVVMVARRSRDLPQQKESVARAIRQAREEPRTDVVLKEPDDFLD